MTDNIQNLFDQLKSEEDKDKKENSTDTNNIDNLFNSLGQPAITSSPIEPFTPSSFTPSVNLEEIDTARKIAYGVAQEPAILGSTYRLGKAALQSAFSEETFDQASKRIERERQEEIFDDFPEFKGLSEQREDAAILSGRVGLALADPITFLVPWTKIAKSGKIAVAATGAGVTTADVALREKTLYGDIDPTTLAIAGTIGGGSSLLGDVVARKFGRGTLSDKEIADLEDVTPTALSQPYVQKSVMALQDAPNNGQEVNDLNKIRYAYLDALKLKRSMRGGEYKSLEGKKKSVEKNIIGKEKQYRKELEELRAKPAVLRDDQKMKLVSKEELDKLRQAPARKVSTTYTPLSKIREAVVAKERGIVKKQINQSEVLNKELSKLYDIDEVLKQPLEELDLLYARAGVKSYDELKQAAKDAKLALSSKYAEMHQQANNMANVGMSPLYELDKKGNLTENLTRSIMSEITRPLFGGGVGFGLGAAFGDEDDSALMWGLTLGGITVGALQKRIQESNFSFSNKSAANDVLDQQLRRSILTTLKISTAGSTAARMSAYGGPLDTASKLLFKQQGATLKGKASLSVEEREMLAIQEYSRVINEEVLPFIDDDLALAAGKLQNKFITEEDVFAQFAEDKARKVLLYRDNIQKFTDQIADSVDDVGIAWNRLDENEVYGLTQMWDWKAIHKSPNEFREKLYAAIAQQQSLHPIRDSRRIEKIADEFTASLSGLQTKTVFDKTQKNVIIPLTKNFEKKRILTDQKSRLLMQDFLINDPRLTLQTLVNNTTKSVEFARTFGPKGELLKSIRQQIHNKYSKVDSKGIRGRKLKDKEIKQLNDAIDGYFGLYQANQRWSETGQTTMALLTGLANSTMLTRVALPSLGDLIQPLQNSGFMPVIKAYGKQFREGKTFADQGLGIKYSSQIENELRALQFGVDPNNVWQKGISDLNRKFFQIVQLERITNYARAKAYDAGVYRAFAISKKKKVKGSLKTEADSLGIGKNELQVLRQFKNAEEAYEDAVGKKILHIAGFKSAERDALIPTVGNRLLFAQSNNPGIRALGQFLSWAQAKTTQTNALLKRIEDGDGKQAVRMLAALSLYGGVRELQIALSPSSYYEDEANVPERFSKKWIGQAVTLSGNVPFQVDKITNAVAGPGAVSPVSQMVPVLSLMDDLVRSPVRVGKNISADDYVGAASNVLDVTPFGKDFRQILNNAGISEAALGSKIVDEPNVDKGSNIDRMFRSVGGAIGDEYKVDDVPYVKEDSKERINPFTGRPYTDAYQRRTGLNTGGTPLTFNQQYHRDTIKNKEAFQNIDGNVVTANVIGVEYKGKIYNLPSYDRRGGFFTPEELRKKYEVEMETGVIKGYDKNFDGPRENHPANVAARREHKLMQDEAELAREAVKYKDTPSKEIVSGLKAGMKALGFADGGRIPFGAGGIASILRGIWKAPTQDFTSAATSISQTPAGFKKIKALDGWQAGTKNLDIGGGASFKGGHKHTDALREEGVENLVFDPFNRTPEENALAVERLGFGKADTVTAHNVLNVIPDETSQLQVIKQMENALKPGGRGYITVYKGAGTGKGKQSRSDSFQQNKKTDEYLPLIRKVFPNAERKGDLIYFNKANNIKQNERIIYMDDLTTPMTIKEIGTFKVVKDDAIDGNVNVGEILGIKVELFRDPGGLAGENYSMIIKDSRIKGNANIGLYAKNLQEAKQEAVREIEVLVKTGELKQLKFNKLETVYETDGRPYIFEDDKMLSTLRAMLKQNK